MEVHHHPDLHHKSKKWKEYFLEFLMIFLAVTMGFFAENIRESNLEHETEKRNMEMIMDNLKEDATQLNRDILFNSKSITIIDSLLLLRNKTLKDSNTLKSFYSFFLSSVYSIGFHSNSSSFEMMKNSGSLRLVKNKQILDTLYLYDNLRKNIVETETYYEANKTKAVEESGNFLLYDNHHESIFNIDSNGSAINRFYQAFFVVQDVLILAYVPQLKTELKFANVLIKKLQDEYHFENK